MGVRMFPTQAPDYVTKMFNGLMNTLGLENGFNDLRDNESRAARHKQRGDDVLQSLHISSVLQQSGRSDEYEVARDVLRGLS